MCSLGKYSTNKRRSVRKSTLAEYSTSEGVSFPIKRVSLVINYGVLRFDFSSLYFYQLQVLKTYCHSVYLMTRYHRCKVNSISSSHRETRGKKGLHRESPRVSGEGIFRDTGCGFDDRETNIDRTGNRRYTRTRLIGRRDVCTHRSDRIGVLPPRVKLDPQPSRSVYGSCTVHGLCIIST